MTGIKDLRSMSKIEYRWHEQKENSNLFQSEINVLTSGLNGEFQICQEFDPNNEGGRLVFWGRLSYGSKSVQDILIIFPPTYPYAPPVIRAIEVRLKEDGSPVLPFLNRQFSKGQQYSNGDLCLLRKDAWDGKQFGIGFLLRKAQKWLEAATSDRGFSPDQVVLEDLGPLPHIGQILFPPSFELPKDLKNGRIFLKRFKENYFIAYTPGTDMDLGNISNNHYEEAYWFRVEEGVSFKHLFSKGINFVILERLINKYSGNSFFLEADWDSCLLGFYFPLEVKWHFFKIQNIKTKGNFGNLNVLPTVQYLITKSLGSELYLRVEDIYDLDELKKKVVTIIGLGAIGSEVANELVNSGVQKFNFFDFDTVEVGNISRHLADLTFIGESKVSVVKTMLQKRNPNVIINCFNQNILENNVGLDESLRNSDAVMILTADEYVDYFINDVLIPKFSIPFLFARASKGALSGVVQIVKHGQTACLRCLNIKSLGNPPPSRINIDALKELPMEYGSCSLPALPGSGIDTKEIALQVARITIQLLNKGKKGVYPKAGGFQYFWHGPAGSLKHAPYTWEIKKIKPTKECTVCNN